MDRYDRLRTERPDLFVNSPDGIDVLLDPAAVDAARRSAGPDEPIGVVYEDAYVTVVRDVVRFPDGAHGLYLRVLPRATGPGVVVLPLTPAGRVVLVEHYRHATRGWHWEVPRGMGEPGASGADSAARELHEEIGARPADLVPLGALHPDTGLLSSRVELFAARLLPLTGEGAGATSGDGGAGSAARGSGGAGAAAGPVDGAAGCGAGGVVEPDCVGTWDVTEGIRRTATVSGPELEAMISSGAITDAFTIAAYARARLAGVLGPAGGVASDPNPATGS
ncbi:NUDIX hydrolase [Streptomyces sp. 796.1]|uniref:NUDIX hydrolase n=1 Tax=Streptomyces sp. 796.1 TaxID=3163029 RepID=UPI0039C96A69